MTAESLKPFLALAGGGGGGNTGVNGENVEMKRNHLIKIMLLFSGVALLVVILTTVLSLSVCSMLFLYLLF